MDSGVLAKDSEVMVLDSGVLMAGPEVSVLTYSMDWLFHDKISVYALGK